MAAGLVASVLWRDSNLSGQLYGSDKWIFQAMKIQRRFNWKCVRWRSNGFNSAFIHNSEHAAHYIVIWIPNSVKELLITGSYINI